MAQRQCFLAQLIIITAFILCHFFIQGQILAEDYSPELRALNQSELSNWQAPEKIRANCPYVLSGYDEDYQPIWIIEFGKWPVRHLLELGPDWEENMDKYMNQMILTIMASPGLISTPEHPVHQYNAIVDLEGFNLDALTSAKTMKFIITKFQLVSVAMKYTSRCFMVNVNYVGERAVNMIRPVIGQGFDKFEVFGTNSDVWIPKILKVLPQSQIPEWLGGTKDFKPVRVYG